MVCRLIAIGKLYQEPEIKTSSDGKPLMKFTIRAYNGSAQWMNVVIFGDKQVEYFKKKIKVGDILYVSGDLCCREYTDKNGQMQRYYSVNIGLGGAVEVIKDSEKKDYISDRSNEDEFTSHNPILDDDIPF